MMIFKLFESKKSTFVSWAFVSEEKKKVILVQTKLNLEMLFKDLSKLADIILQFKFGEEKFGVITFYIDDENILGMQKLYE